LTELVKPSDGNGSSKELLVLFLLILTNAPMILLNWLTLFSTTTTSGSKLVAGMTFGIA
jgi:hypothetical protein